jgi:hypothetical protein
MGNIDSSTNDYGNLFVEISDPWIYAGTSLRGSVHLNLEKDFPAASLKLLIKGKEKCKFWISDQKQNLKYENKNSVLDSEHQLYLFTKRTISAG